MSLAIVGAGMVSPSAMTARQHAFFAAAGVPAPSPSPFVRDTGERIDVRYCRWLGAVEPLPSRLMQMAQRAIEEATAALVPEVQVSLLVVTSAPRPGLSTELLADTARAIARQRRLGSMQRYEGEAAFFDALADAGNTLSKQGPQAVCIVAVDSAVSVDLLADAVLRPPSPWARAPLPHSEGAAAVVLMSPPNARRVGMPVIGALQGATTAMGNTRDDNDEPADGVAMTQVLSSMPSTESIAHVFGQSCTDDLRAQDWYFASARESARFGTACVFEGIEDHVGRVGAAAGAMNLVYGLSVLRHETSALRAPSDSFLAWAISPDGTRGIAAVRVGAP
ncbi:hypothetical protein [Polyangium sorediatum]|uniref:Beta-ketoacyl synthase N-terminal domain-containing protein n=1 Tax=Polyangium sorediatum TaxID=889274 RepID=A0ABT6NLB5_9BACT|nr:hypothetical protein [Polyangium sorediatum]MDI1429105.1 hypothetical protein [Polyangium sorediatum]